MPIQSLADILSIVILALGAIGGAAWTFHIYRQRRGRFPKANLAQKVQAIKLDDDNVCIHTSVSIKNIGDVMLSICSAKNSAYQIRPLHASIREGLNGQRQLYDDLNKEINWPALDSKEVTWGLGQFQIEPAEGDTVHFDLIIPSDVEVIQLYTYFKNVKKRKHEIGWTSSDFYEVAKIAQLGGEK